MATLKDEHKRFIVIELAQGSTPQEVADAVKEEFNLDVTRQQVRHYNPEQSKDVAAELAELFFAEKARAESDLERVGATRQSYRLKRLHQMLLKARKMAEPKPNRLGVMVEPPAKTITKALELEAKLLEQIARERGGAYTNRRELTGKNGGAIQTQEQPPDLSNLTDEELDAFERLLAKSDARRQHSARSDAARSDAARSDAARSDAARSDAARSDAARSDAGGSAGGTKAA